MLHGIKLAMNGRGAGDLLENDKGIAYAQRVVTDLLRWFPQLQAAVEENDKTWCTLGYNMKTVASTAQEIYGEQHPMMVMLESLQSASAKVASVQGHELEDERAKASTELREFNECLRSLRTLQEECVQTLKNKMYYQGKVDGIRRRDTEKSAKKKPNEKEVEKRLRNEQKLTEVNGLLDFKSDKLTRELSAILERKDKVLGTVLACYVHTQNCNFARNPMPAVIAYMPTTSPSSFQERSQGFSQHSSSLSNGGAAQRHSSYDQPPRAPSPPSSYDHQSRAASAHSSYDQPSRGPSPPPSYEQPPRAPSPTLGKVASYDQPRRASPPASPQRDQREQQQAHRYSNPTLSDEPSYQNLYPSSSEQAPGAEMYAYGAHMPLATQEHKNGGGQLRVGRPGSNASSEVQRPTDSTAATYVEHLQGGGTAPTPPPAPFY